MEERLHEREGGRERASRALRRRKLQYRCLRCCDATRTTACLAPRAPPSGRLQSSTCISQLAVLMQSTAQMC